MQKGQEEQNELLDFDVKSAKQQEAQRRYTLLGDLCHREYSYEQIRIRARDTFIPTRVLWSWLQNWYKQGLKGLEPQHWKALSEEEEAKVRVRYCQFAPIFLLLENSKDKEDLTESNREEQIKIFAEQQGLSLRTTQRWLSRYQIEGLWGLAPSYNPEKQLKRRKKTSKPGLELPDVAALDEKDWQEIERRLDLLGTLKDKTTVSRQEVEEQALAVNKSESLIWDYWRRHRDYSLRGLAPKPRSDKGDVHNLSEPMLQIVQGLKLSKRKKSVRAIHVEACQRAQALGEVAPTLWQVRRICASIPKPDATLANGPRKDFRNKYVFTRDMKEARLRQSAIIYEIDHNLVDVLAQDIREEYATPSKTIRPWLTLCLHRRSRLVMAATFSYDRPDRYVVAETIRKAILKSEIKNYGGIPDEIWVDNGLELVSNHVRQLTKGLGIHLHPCTPGQPQERGTQERFFGVLNTRLWANTPGYVTSNTVERDPRVKAELTLAQLEERFWDFIIRYHQDPHSRLTHENRSYTPLSYWQEHCYAEGPDDSHDLDFLLMEPESRKVLRPGIQYENRMFWAADLNDFVGQYVEIRVAATYGLHDSLEVYSLQKEWICTAYSGDSPQGQQVTAAEVYAARSEQKKTIRKRIRKARNQVDEADKTIQNMVTSSQQEKEISEASLSLPPEQTVETQRVPEPSKEISESVAPLPQAVSTPKKTTNLPAPKDSNTGNFLDFMIEQEQ